MSRFIDVNRLYRDSSRAMVSGVCAGLARYWSTPPWIIRGATILAFLAFPMPVAIAYLMAILLIRSR